MTSTISADVAVLNPPVSIIIPNFNGASLLRNNLPSVQQALSEYPGSGELIVVDDGSRDDSRDILAAEFPEVRLIRHEDNRGFAEAIHSGVNAARFEHLILLNSDVRPGPGFIAPLVRQLQDPAVFSASPLILEETGKIHPCSLNCFSVRKGRLNRLRGEWARPAHNGPIRPSSFASGGSMAVKKSRFLELKGFLPIFRPFYWEDFDLGIRAWRRGWRVVMAPSSIVVHQHRGSIRENVARRRVRTAVQRNKILVEWIHAPVALLLGGFIPRLFLRVVARTMLADPVFWPALIGALARLPQVISIRREISADQGMTKSLPEILVEIEQENKRLFERESGRL